MFGSQLSVTGRLVQAEPCPIAIGSIVAVRVASFADDGRSFGARSVAVTPPSGRQAHQQPTQQVQQVLNGIESVNC